jgi:signal transduction histidine kinase
VLDRVVAVIRRTGPGGRLAWHIDASPGRLARIDADDLTEALGALLENAARHARAAVTVAVAAEPGRIAISIEDDGPGIPDERLDELTARGARLDLAGPGTGLGLAIAAEIAQAAGGALELANLRPGLRATLAVPAVPDLTGR